MASECMECVEGRAVALGLCSHCLAGEPVEAVVGQIARLARELEEARALLRELTGPEPVLDDARLRYVEIQVDREAWDDARRFVGLDLIGDDNMTAARRGEGGGE